MVFVQGRVLLLASCSVYSLPLFMTALAVSKDSQVDVIFIDFSKAFDTVPHNFLIKELDGIGIGDPPFVFVPLYLSNHKQFVKLNGVS